MGPEIDCLDDQMDDGDSSPPPSNHADSPVANASGSQTQSKKSVQRGARCVHHFFPVQYSTSSRTVGLTLNDLISSLMIEPVKYVVQPRYVKGQWGQSAGIKPGLDLGLDGGWCAGLTHVMTALLVSSLSDAMPWRRRPEQRRQSLQ